MPKYVCDRPKHNPAHPGGTCSHVTELPRQLAIGQTVPCGRLGCNGRVSRLGKHAPNPGTRSGINPNLVIGQNPNFAPNFEEHMMHGENTAGIGPHSGLHSLNRMHGGRINDRAAVIVGNVNANIPFQAVVSLGQGAPKRSTFFPTQMTYQDIRAAVVTAWTDYQRYRTVDIYQRMLAKSGLQWVGYASLRGRKTWVGSDRNGTGNPIYTAFPAFNGRFF